MTCGVLPKGALVMQTLPHVSQPSDPRLGTTIAGYRIDEVIGRGGMGIVYLAEHLRLQRRVALKLLAPELVDRPGFRERFIRESRLAASIDHPNILPIHDADEIGDVLYIAMRYVEGTDLKRLITERGRLDPAPAVRIVSQVASALDAAHARGLVHRDVKPGNVLIASGSGSGEDGHVYLSDFGLTKRTSSDSGLTATGQFVGTLDYAAPEQFEGRALDGRTDEYSLGCVLFECLTGAVPFERDNDAAVMYAHLQAPTPRVTEVHPDLPPAIDAVVATAMAKSPSDRYPTAGGMASAAADALRVSPVTSTTPTRPMLPAQRQRRTGWLIGVGAAVVAVVVLLVVLLNGDGKAPAAGPESSPTTSALADYVARINPATGVVTAKIPVGPDPIDVAVGEGSVWVLDGDGSVERIDPVSGKAVLIQTAAEDPRALAVDERGVWLANGFNGVLEIDLGSNRVKSSFEIRGIADDVATDGEAVWVAAEDHLFQVDSVSGAVSEVDGSLVSAGGLGRNADAFVAAGEGYAWHSYTADANVGRVTGTSGHYESFQYDFIPKGIATAGSDVWFARCGTPGTVLRVDANTGKALTSISAGGAVCPYFNVTGNPIALAASEESVWVTDGANGTVSRIQVATNEVGPPIRVGDTPTSVAVGLSSVWVAVDGSSS
jgi:serine/threonine-protein kinase